MRPGAGALTGMMMTLKGLPLAYNKDMQEDKEGLFDALDTRLDCLHMAALVLDGIQVKRPRCRGSGSAGLRQRHRTGGLSGGERRTVPRGAPYCW